MSKKDDDLRKFNELRRKVIEKERNLEKKISSLKNIFRDTLESDISKAAMIATCIHGEITSVEIGVPYLISKEQEKPDYPEKWYIEIGPYIISTKNKLPEDFNSRKKRLYIGNIVDYKRVELLE